MRSLLALLMATAVLLAQDEPETPEKPEKPETPEKRKGEAESAPAKARRTEIDRIVEELQKELGGENDELLRRLIEQLERHRKKDAEIVVLGEGGPLELRGGTLGLLIAPDGAAETMTGTFEADGRKGKYTLKSTGNGRYQLDAKISGDGGTTSTVKDDGTYAELRAKYKWLRSGSIYLASRGRLTLDPDSGALLDLSGRKARPVVGVLVRPPADELRHHLEIPVGAGLVVESVTPGSRAEQLGLRQYDVLLRIDGELVETSGQVRKLAGKGVTLEYVRRAKKKRLVTE